MDIRIKIFTLLGICSTVMGMNFSAFAACYSSEAGEYCLTNKRYTCPAGCYCQKAPGDYGALDRKGNGQREIYEEDVAAWCKNGTACKWSGGTGQCGTSDDAKVFRCPANHPTSNPGATSEQECYQKCSGSGQPYYGETLYNKSKSCSQGQYRPKGSNDCAPCPDDGKSICEGVSSFTPLCTGASSDQGIKTCDSGSQPNSSRTACEQKLEEKKEDDPIGDISVQPGYYLPGKSTTPKQCSESTYYCPGGDYAGSGEDQGKFKCPKGTIANQKRTACVARIPKNNLKTGPNPNTPEDFQCWMNVTDIEKYKLCVIANPYYK